MNRTLLHAFIVALAAGVLTLTACRPAVGQNDAATAQSESQRKDEKKNEKKDEKKEAAPEGKPVLWQEPADISSRNLLLGPGGEEMKPDLKQVIWEATEDDGGYSVKWRVRDASGRKWVVKVGNEAQPETASTRLLWAAGYPVEVTYLVPCVKIVNSPKPRKKVEQCEGKGYANVRFEARPENVRRLDNWSWNENPFKGTNEFAGLVVMMGLLNNWDLKDSNNKVVFVPGEGGQGELRYIISDLGATFGKTGNFITHSRNEPEKYVKTGFVDKVEGGFVRFDYSGKNGGLFDGVTVEQARWIGELLSRLTEEQIMDAFRAANYKPEEVEALAQEVMGRINALKTLPAAPATAGTPAP